MTSELVPGIRHFVPDPNWMKLDVFYDNGKLKPMPTRFWTDLGYTTTRSMLHFKAQYFLPTLESLVDLQQILGKDLSGCLEIGAGNGWLGYLLGMRMTDNHRQSDLSIRMAYLAGGQPTINYGEDVERLDALSAVRKYMPHTVVGSWISEKNRLTLPDGVDEVELLKLVDRYVLIGTDAIHGHKIISRQRHKKLKFSSLLSRTERASENSIWVWEK